MYTYRATVVSVYDGDTATLDVDLGFYITVRMACRLLGINAPEMGSAAGLASREALRALLPVGERVTVQSIKTDKYGGRFDGVIINRAGESVSALMVEQGFAIPWDGKGPRPTLGSRSTHRSRH